MVAIFPTQYSLLSATALKDHVEQRYGFGELTGSLLLHNVSDTYLLASPTDKYIFKVYRRAHRSLTEIRGEVELLTTLKEQGAKVSYPLSDLTGSYIQEFNAAEGIRHGVLFTFAPGKPVYDLTDEQLTIVGREMAFVHNITSRIDLQHDRKVYDINTTIIEPLKTLKQAFADDPDSYDYLLATADRVIRKMASIDTAAFNYGYCHYDFLPKNFHFDPDNTLTFFDFDFAGKGFLANDLLSFSLHFFFHASAGKLTQAEADRAFGVFLAGYRAIRSISDEEIAAIPYLGFMFWTFYLGFQYENFDDWSNFFFTPRYVKDFVDSRVKRYVDRYCQF
ncbi:MAG: phosphotransferase [Bacteroidetes bacterium]|nr:phosphotransferase [Fibrella sp.]